eukprot:4462449-Alexandrium_andersonii.AAC.1
MKSRRVLANGGTPASFKMWAWASWHQCAAQEQPTGRTRKQGQQAPLQLPPGSNSAASTGERAGDA